MSPKTVAEACIEVLGRLGTVKTVSRETGTIAGKLSVNLIAHPVFINIKIEGSGEGSTITVQTERKEGFLTGGGAQKGLARFLEELGRHEKLTGASKSGW